MCLDFPWCGFLSIWILNIYSDNASCRFLFLVVRDGFQCMRYTGLFECVGLFEIRIIYDFKPTKTEPTNAFRCSLLDGAVVVTTKSDFCVHMRTQNISIFIRDSGSYIPCNYSALYTVYTQMKPNIMGLVLRG